MKILPLVLIVTPAVALAVSPFDGSWKTRPGSFRASDKPYVFSVDQTEYRCVSCVPPFGVKADGQYHKVTGHGFDSASAKIVDSSTVEINERTGEKVIEKQTFAASQDGSQLRVKMIDESGEKPVSMQATLKRSADTGPEKDKHSVSGTWVVESVKPAEVPITLSMTEESFSWGSNGQHYQAKFDGTPAALEGDPTHLTVSVKKVRANEVEETDTRDGKPVYQLVFSVAPDGKSLNVTETDPRSGRKYHYVMDKQP